MAQSRAVAAVARPVGPVTRPRRKQARTAAGTTPATRAAPHDGPLGVQLLLSAQRSAGNRATSSLLAGRRANPGAGVQPVAQRGLADDAAAAAGGLLDALRARAASLVAAVRERAGAAWARLRALGSSLSEGLESLAGSAVERVTARWRALQDRARSLWDALATRARSLAASVKGRLAQLVTGLRRGWDGLEDAGRHLLDGLKQRAAGLLELAKGRGTAMLGGPGACVTPETLHGVRGALDREGGAGLGGLDSAADGSLAGLAARWSALDAESRGGSGELNGFGGQASSELGAEVGSATAGVQTAGGELRAQAGAAGEEVGGRSATAVEGARTEHATAVSEVRNEADSGASGLRGMLGTIGSLLAGAAESVIGSAAGQAGAAESDLRGKGSSLLSGLEGLARSLAQRLAALIQQVEAGLGGVLRELSARPDAARDLLRQGWDWARNRASGVLGKLRSGWSWLRSRAGAAWRAVRDRLLGLRGRASAALGLAEADSCSLDRARGEADVLAAARIDAPGGAAIRSPVLFKGRPGLATLAAGPATLARRIGGGQPLEPRVRARMEGAFGADFSGVRVHTDAEGARSADELNARAYTIGEHVAFGTGEYRPDTLLGDALIAHELSHLVQQRTAGAAAFAAEDGSETAVEMDADRSAVLAVARIWLGAKAALVPALESAMPRLRSGLGLRRCGKEKCCTDTPAPTGPLVPVEPQHDCEPFAEERNNVFATQKLASPTDRPTHYGKTTISLTDGPAALDPALVALDGKCGERCKPTGSEPRFVLSPFIYVKAGRYDDGTRKAPAGTKCAGKRLPAFEVVSDKLAAKIKAAEVEHCRDLKVAWRKTIGRYQAAVNELTGGFCVEHGDGGPKVGNCKDEYARRLEARTGMSYAGMKTIWECLAGLTVTQRDDKKFHNISGKTTTVVTPDCKEIEVHDADDASVLSHVGSPTSEELVKDCGEP